MYNYSPDELLGPDLGVGIAFGADIDSLTTDHTGLLLGCSDSLSDFLFSSPSVCLDDWDKPPLIGEDDLACFGGITFDVCGARRKFQTKI